MKAAIASLLLIAAFPAAAAPACPRVARDYVRKADLPAGARAALFPMAERGGRFMQTDDIGPGEDHLPFARFISARQSGCSLRVRYEYGGYVQGVATALLELRGGAWVLVRQR